MVRKKSLLVIVGIVLATVMLIGIIGAVIPPIKDKCDHVWDDGKTVVAATCTTDGKTVYSCTLCGKAKTVIVPAGHTVVEDEGVPATCTTPGMTSGSHCSVCNEVLIESTVIDPLGHDIVEDICPYCGETLWTKNY